MGINCLGSPKIQKKDYRHLCIDNLFKNIITILLYVRLLLFYLAAGVVAGLAVPPRSFITRGVRSVAIVVSR